MHSKDYVHDSVYTVPTPVAAVGRHGTTEDPTVVSMITYLVRQRLCFFESRCERRSIRWDQRVHDKRDRTPCFPNGISWSRQGTNKLTSPCIGSRVHGYGLDTQIFTSTMYSLKEEKNQVWEGEHRKQDGYLRTECRLLLYGTILLLLTCTISPRLATSCRESMKKK
jgi:hypothetical protein